MNSKLMSSMTHRRQTHIQIQVQIRSQIFIQIPKLKFKLRIGFKFDPNSEFWSRYSEQECYLQQSLWTAGAKVKLSGVVPVAEPIFSVLHSLLH